MQLIFASNNQHKIEELKAILPVQFSIITLQQAGFNKEIPEPFDTLEENAREKAQTIFNLLHQACFSEDSGLEAAALNGRPGVRSARFAGEKASAQQNIAQLFEELKNNKNRQAQFRTVICLIFNGAETFFEGICKGKITSKQKGTDGFGYDPVFVPDGAEKTFAEMNLAEKNRFSHRKKAVDKLVAFLNTVAINK